MNENQNRRQLKRLPGEAVQIQRQGQRGQHQAAADPVDKVSKLHHLFHIIIRLVVIPGPHAPADDGDHGKVHGLTRQHAHAVQVVGHRVSGDLGCAEGGDDADHQDSAQLEDAVLHASRDADVQDLCDHLPVPGQKAFPHIDGQLPVMKADKQNDAGDHPGYEGRQGRTCHSPLHPEDEKGIACHIDHVHDNGHLHGDLRIAHGPKQRRTGVVHRQKRVGQRRQHQVHQGVSHNVRLHSLVQHPQKPSPAHNGQKHNDRRDEPRDENQLAGRFPGLLLILMPQILGGHHRTACGHGGKHVDNQVVDHVHQRHAGRGRLPGAGDHHGVRHAHGDRQDLLHDQGGDQAHQIPVGKQISFSLLHSCSLLSYIMLCFLLLIRGYSLLGRMSTVILYGFVRD